MERGADFSSYQSPAAVAAAIAHGIRFAFVKLTEGTGYENPFAAAQLGALDRAGVRLGVYHYLDAGPGGPQWAFFQARLEALHLRVPVLVALDFEQQGATEAEARAFLLDGKRAGYSVGLYSSLARDHSPLGQAWAWIASWSSVAPPPPWAFWQFAAGTGGSPDWDLFHGDAAALAAFWQHHAGALHHRPRAAYLVRFAGTRKLLPVELGPYRRLRTAALRAVAYALRHPSRPSFTIRRAR